MPIRVVTGRGGTRGPVRVGNAPEIVLFVAGDFLFNMKNPEKMLGDFYAQYSTRPGRKIAINLDGMEHLGEITLRREKLGGHTRYCLHYETIAWTTEGRERVLRIDEPVVFGGSGEGFNPNPNPIPAPDPQTRVALCRDASRPPTVTVAETGRAEYRDDSLLSTGLNTMFVGWDRGGCLFVRNDADVLQFVDDDGVASVVVHLLGFADAARHRSIVEARIAAGHGAEYHYLPWTDHLDAKLATGASTNGAQVLRQVMDIFSQADRDDLIMVHCSAATGRSAVALVLYYVMFSDKLPSMGQIADWLRLHHKFAATPGAEVYNWLNAGYLDMIYKLCGAESREPPPLPGFVARFAFVDACLDDDVSR